MNEMQVDLAEPRDMVLTRIFDAPRHLVWQCWTDPRHLSVWWGPEGFTSRCEQDLRPGGRQTIIMLGPDGTAYPIHATFLEVVAGEKLVSTIAIDDHPPEWHQRFSAYTGGDRRGIMRIVQTVLFEDTADGRTRLTVRQHFQSQTDRDANMKMGAREGWGQSFIKLDALLQTLVA